jgi:hypothetical protein
MHKVFVRGEDRQIVRHEQLRKERIDHTDLDSGSAAGIAKCEAAKRSTI